MRTGYRLAAAVAGITIALAGGLAIAEAFGSTRDADAYGRLSLPGRESVNLPAGDVIIYYGERAGIDFPFPLDAPPNLRLQVRTTNGQLLLGSTPYRSEVLEDTKSSSEYRAVAKLRVPEAGDYEVVSPTRVTGAVDPVLTFGHNGSRDFSYVAFVLFGGLLLAAILAGATRLTDRF
jgi:hypothetical protein